MENLYNLLSYIKDQYTLGGGVFDFNNPELKARVLDEFNVKQAELDNWLYYNQAAGIGLSAALDALPDTYAAFEKYRQTPQSVDPRDTISSVLNNPTYSEQQKSTILESLRNSLGLDEEAFNVLVSNAMGEDIDDIFTDTTAGSTPQETFAGLEEEQKIGRINDALENNPNATLADILDILTSWKIPTDLFRKATGTTPEEYVAQRDAPPSTEPPFEKPGEGGEEGQDNGQLGDDTGKTEVIDDGSTKIDDGGECQPGYEKWNGSCVAVCNAAAGYVRDEATGQCVLKEEKPKPSDEGNGDGGSNGKSCPIGQVYDEALQKCVPIKEEENYVDPNAPKETPISGLPQESTDTGVQGMLGLAAAPSPTRTTESVLPMDLFKIKAGIPLVNLPVTTPSLPAYSNPLFDIYSSQRYKV